MINAYNPINMVFVRVITNKSILTFIQKKQGGCAYAHPPHINTYNIDYIS